MDDDFHIIAAPEHKQKSNTPVYFLLFSFLLFITVVSIGVGKRYGSQNTVQGVQTENRVSPTEIVATSTPLPSQSLTPSPTETATLTPTKRPLSTPTATSTPSPVQ